MDFTAEDIELIERLKHDDQQAFQQLFNRYWKVLYAYASRFVRDEYVADEIVQKLFIRLWEKRLALSIQSLPQYLYMSVKNGCIDYVRSQLNQEKEWKYYSQFLPTKMISPEDEYLNAEILETLKLQLNLLPAKSKEIFERNKIDGLTVDQIAHLMKLSKKAVEYHLTKANKLIKNYLHKLILLIAMAGFSF